MNALQRRSRPALGLLAAAASAALAQEAPPTDAVRIAQVEVIGLSPMPGTGLQRAQFAAAVQTASGEQIARSGALTPADYLARRFGSVSVNEITGNPFQPDVQYRGYNASPLLGTAQGLSVYLDGVRLNQPFGDVVSWDLIPKSAIAGLSLMPGSNPLFGLNTLGGSLAIETKDGRRHPGTTVDASLGSFGRRQVGIETGGSNESGLAWYGSANGFKEDGWRDHSPSRVGQLFGKLEQDLGDAHIGLTLAHADSRLRGNGLQEQGLLAQRRESVYTWPDDTEQRGSLARLLLAAPALGGELNAQVYGRRIRTLTFNGDVNDDALDQNLVSLSGGDRAALDRAGIRYSGATDTSPFPSLRCIAQALQRDEPAEKCNGLLTRGDTLQEQWGVGVQWSRRFATACATHRVLAGAAVDASRVRFRQLAQLGYLNADRSVTGVDAYADGERGGDVDGEPFDSAVGLLARTRNWSVHAADVIEVGPWTLTLSARHDHVRVHNRDARRSAPDPASLDGDHVFARTNPAVGLVWQARPGLQAYAGANQGSRAPSAVELGCANPDRPCKLPNAMAGDPPLKAVVARTIEAGVRGQGAGGLRWSAGVFRTENRDDLLFVADDTAGFGYFRNVGRTRRQGVELSGALTLGPVALELNYTALDATFRSAETVNGSGSSDNSAGPGLEGTIDIRPGDRLPLLPRQMLKAAARWQVAAGWRLDVDAVATAGAIARGNENGRHQPDSTFYLGAGRVPGYALANLGIEWQPSPRIEWSLQVRNLFDREYSTAAQLGAMAFGAKGNFVARPLPRASDGEFPLRNSTFVAPGAPRSVALTLRWIVD